MKKSVLFVLFIGMLHGMLFAQEAPKVDVKFSGFVKTDLIWDSRQTVSVREGHFLLYPQPKVLDLDNEDINAKSNFNILNVQTRMRMLATGPDVFGAKSSAFIEGAFFGSAESNINTFRLRHAFVKLAWTNTELMVGQYWHPLFNTKSFPGTVSFNTGAPFQPFSRNPQVRLTQKFGDISFAVSAIDQRDFASTGPMGPSSVYLRNTGYPAFNLRMQYFRKSDEVIQELLFGLSGNYKALTPRLQTTAGYKTTNTASSFSTSVFGKIKTEEITAKAYWFYGGDPVNLTMIGGYAVSEITDNQKALVDYSPINNMSAWLDLHSNGTTWQAGFFAGYSKNLGSNDKIVGDVYARGNDIDYAWRVAPRLIYNNGKFRIAPEIEYTVAAYAKGEAINEYGEVTVSEEVGNFRFLVGVYYFF